jgi:hypothetical protein
MNTKKSAKHPFRGWLPPEPTWGSRLKNVRFPVTVAVVATLLITSALLIYPALSPAASTLPPAAPLALITPVSNVTSQTYGPVSSGSSYIGGDQNDWGYSIKLTSDDGLIMAGVTQSYADGGTGMWLVKTGPSSYTMSNGVTGSYQREQWNVTFGGAKDDGALAVIQTSDDGYAVAGYTNSLGAGQSDMWLVKTNADGVMQWEMTYSGSGNSSANSLIQTIDGGYLLVGYTNSGVQSRVSWVVKTDATGNIQWKETLPGTDAVSVVETSSGGYALAVQYSDAFGLVVIDASGNMLLNQTYPAPADQASAQAIVRGVDGGYAIAGYVTHSNTQVNDTWLVKTDDAGQEQWSKVYPGLGGYALIQTAEGGYALTGDRAFLIVTDSSGNIEWNQIYDEETGNGSQYPTRMQSIIEASPDHFVMVGYQKAPIWISSGNYMHWQLLWIQVALKSGAQTIPPQTTILSPTNVTYTQRNVPLTFYVNQSTSYLLYTVNHYANVSISGNTTLTNLPNGEYSLAVVSTDSNYNTAASQTVTFTVNSTEPYVPPTVTIQSPADQTYYGSQINLVYSVTQPVFWTAYNIDGGANMTAFPNVALFSLANGAHSLTLYAGDVAGGPAGKATVHFTVSAPPNQPPYSTFNPLNSTYASALSQMVGFAEHTLLSPLFLVLTGFTIAAMISAVITVIVLTMQKPPKKTEPLL